MKKRNAYYNDKHIDEVGRIVLPKSVRTQAGIVSEKTPLEIYTENDKIIIRPYSPGCVICGNTENTIELKGKKVCLECVEKLQAIKELNK